MSRRIARPYAQALLAVVKPQGSQALQEANEALAAAASAFACLPELVRAFELPTLSPKEKAKLLREVAQALALPPVVERLLHLLQSHFRLRYLGAVSAEFSLACDGIFGVVRGHLEAPAPLSSEKLAALASVLGSILGIQVRLEQQVQPELLAGFVVRLGSLLFDGSLKRQLERFAGTKLPAGGPHAG
jgi:F-type H+-transporting ATPase subunit delta